MSEVRQKADFGIVRYAQVWEDADVLCQALDVGAMGSRRGSFGAGEDEAGAGRFASICSGGDNALALLTIDPARVVAFDYSQAQLDCLALRIAAYRRLDHEALLELLGSRPSSRRGALLDEVRAGLEPNASAFWAARRNEVVAHGAAGIGKFEGYLRLFREKVLPLAHGRETIEAAFEPRDREARAEFLERSWRNWRWRLLVRAFFSRFVMGRLGRDPAFFEHAVGSLPDHVEKRIREAFVSQDPSENPYLAWLLTGTHRDALPRALRKEHFEQIRARLDRVELRLGGIGDLGADGERFDAFNLSDVFEYMSPVEHAREYGRVLDAAAPGARIAYWNMMAPRALPEEHAGRARRVGILSDVLHAQDKAFFYRAFHLDEVAP